MKVFTKIAVYSALPLMLTNTALAAEAPNLAERAAADYLELAKYPEWSLPIPADAANPILSERDPAVLSQSGPNGAGPALSIWLDEVRYELGETVSVFARLQDRALADSDILTSPQPKAAGPWTVSGEVVSQTGDAMGSLEFNDKGEGADAQAGDGIFSAGYTLTDSGQPAPGQATNLGYRVTATNDAQETRVAFGGFQYSHPAAALTGVFKDRVENGSLVISAQIDVKRAGRVHIAGVLNAVTGTPLAAAQAAKVVAEGVQWVDLTVYGLILREAALAGPFTLSSVTLTSTQGMPNALGPVLEDAHTTSSYLPVAFTDKGFGRVDLLDAAARLQAIAAP